MEAKGHTEVVDAAVEATCTETGLTEGKHCSACNEVLVKQEVVEAKGHTEVVDAAVEATCTETGLTEGKHCSVCGTVLTEQEVVEAKGHTEVVDAAVEATCTETGLTEGKHCSVCGEVLVKQEVVEAKGHTEVVDAAVEATCTETGLTEGKHCSVCEEVLVKQEVVEAKGHTEVVDDAVEATCTETGLTEGKHCSVCEEVLVKQEAIEAKGHKWSDWSVTTEATFGKAGVRSRSCENCDATETEEIAQLELPFEDVTADSPFVSAIAWAKEKGITRGINAEGTLFGTDRSCTRGQIVTFLWRAAGSPAPSSTSAKFKDIGSSSPFYRAVLWAVEKGITQGLTRDTFGVDQSCTRGQAVTFMYRYVGAPEGAKKANFSDVSEKSFCYKAVCWAAEKGVTMGTSAAAFSPDAACTRGQIVTFLYRNLAK
ncbi:MAG: S-layer homology domain-containing protein [Lachnospiraceae bacterium]|nr:S-layer homology domain-containing protein [Lachnospiraceae bacterium]